MNKVKEAFLKNEFISLLYNLQPGQKGKWGKMDAQQMVEHFRQAIKVANGKIKTTNQAIDPIKLEKIRQFLMSEVPFKENTKSPMLGEEPLPHKFSSLKEAIDQLEIELKAMFLFYKNNPEQVVFNPVFGEMNYDHQIQLIHKHAMHHLLQFELV